MSTIDMVKAANQGDFGAFKAAFMEEFKSVDLVEGRELLDQLIEAELDEDKAYDEFFKKVLKKFGVESPDELEGDQEEKFYDYVDKNWESDEEDDDEEESDDDDDK